MLPLHSSSHLLSLNKQPFPALPTHSSQCYQRPGHSQADTHLPLCSHFIPSQRLNNSSRCSLPVLNKIFCYVCCVIGSLPLFAFLLESCDSTSIWQCPNVCPVHRLPRYSKMVQVFQNADSLWTNHSLWVKEINLVSADFRKWDMSPFCKKKKTHLNLNVNTCECMRFDVKSERHFNVIKCAWMHSHQWKAGISLLGFPLFLNEVYFYFGWRWLSDTKGSWPNKCLKQCLKLCSFS